MIREYKKRYRVLKELIRIRFQNLMVFRLSFLGPFFVDGTLFLIQLLAFQAIYANVDQIGTWGKGEMMIYIGTFSLLNAVNMIIFFFGVNGIPNKIRNGEMDLYLTKPISPLFRLSLEKMNPGAILLLAMSICIIAYGLQMTRLEIGIAQMGAYTFWIVLMLILYYETEVIIRTMSFYVVSTSQIEQIEVIGLDLCMQLPGIVFYGGYKVIFCCILPYGIMATFPVQSLIGEMTMVHGLYGIGLTVVYTFLTRGLWKNGIKRYSSVSS